MSVDIDSLFEHREPIRKPGWQKALPWVTGVLLVAGVIAVLIWKFSNTGHSTATPLSNRPAVDLSAVPKTIKLDPAARRVAKRFIQTAVARKNLREAYALAGPAIRQGMTLEEWMTGNIAVIPYPVDSVEYAPMKIDFSYPREVQVEIALLPKAGTKIRPQLFILGLNKNARGDWVVNSWVPRSSPPVPSASGYNG